ncbi:MAG TPA: 50S ribosomal protein L29 [Bdellovibrionota bacterium]|nr:50S ribosomal protein L29 [Bdellovibrionota bacterium]
MRTKAKELRNLDAAELKRKEEDLQGELMNLRFQHHMAQLNNPMRMRAVKKNIAQIKTVLRERELKK